MKRQQKRAKALRVWCVILALLLIGTAATWYLAYRNGWWFYNDEYLTRQLDDLARSYYHDYRERIITESGVEAATNNLRRIENQNGLVVNLHDLFIGKNAAQTKLRDRYEQAACNDKQTVTNMIPREPYGANDLEIKLKLVCNF